MKGEPPPLPYEGYGPASIPIEDDVNDEIEFEEWCDSQLPDFIEEGLVESREPRPASERPCK